MRRQQLYYLKVVRTTKKHWVVFFKKQIGRAYTFQGSNGECSYIFQFNKLTTY